MRRKLPGGNPRDGGNGLGIGEVLGIESLAGFVPLAVAGRNAVRPGRADGTRGAVSGLARFRPGERAMGQSVILGVRHFLGTTAGEDNSGGGENESLIRGGGGLNRAPILTPKGWRQSSPDCPCCPVSLLPYALQCGFQGRGLKRSAIASAASERASTQSPARSCVLPRT